jgi:exodeoxyribonuclease VII small subunit
MAAAKKPEPENGAAESFDQRLARLEAIVLELENETIPLETAIERYQEGVAHLQGCRTILDGFKKRVEQLSSDAQAGTVPYGGDPDAPSERAGDRAGEKRS